MTTLGKELKTLRDLKGWSLRDVEEKTKRKVSNSYLNQLENDLVKEPSPNILYELAKVYSVSYMDLMRVAGFVVPQSSERPLRNQTSVAFSALDLTEDEKQEVLDFVGYLRSKNKKRR